MALNAYLRFPVQPRRLTFARQRKTDCSLCAATIASHLPATPDDPARAVLQIWDLEIMEIIQPAAVMALSAVVFGFVIWAYFRVSEHFQSETRDQRGWGSDRVSMLLAIGLVAGFTVSYIEIFIYAFRLPFSGPVDVTIGLAAAMMAMAAAYTAQSFSEKRAAKAVQPQN